MRKFILQIAIFAIGALALIAAIELSLFLVPNEFSYRMDYLKENSGKINTVILGNSVTNNSIVPDEISDSVFGFAANAKPIYVDNALVRMFAEKYPGIKCIVMPVSYRMDFNATITDPNKANFHTSRRCRIHKYWGIPVDGAPRWKYLSEVRWSNNSILLKYFNDNVYCRNSGWEPTPEGQGGLIPIETVQKSLQLNDPIVRRNVDINMHHLTELAKTCNEHDIRLVLVTTPYYSEDTTAVDKALFADMRKCVDAMLSVCPDAEYYDFSFDKDFTRDDFYNSDHLNETGAHKFTKKLKPIILIL